MPIVGRLDQFGSIIVTSEFNEIVGGNVRVTGLGTYYASEFKENIGVGTTLTANVFPPYNTLYDEFAGVFYGPGPGTFMRQELTGNVVVYNEIDEIGLDQSYVIVPQSFTINEGDTMIIEINTNNVPDDTQLYYEII